MSNHTDPNRTGSGWARHRRRQAELSTWLDREDRLATAVEDGSVVDAADLLNPSHSIDGEEREAMLRAAFQRWTTTWEGVLQLRLELGDDPAEAIAVAQARATEVRGAEWRAVLRAAQSVEGWADADVVADLVRRQRARVARVTGLTGAALERAYARAEGRTPSHPSFGVPALLQVRRARRARRTSRVLARRAG